MDIPTIPGAVYSVVSPTACTITDKATGRVLETTDPNKQKDFRAFGSITTLSDPNAIYVAASTFSAAPTIGSGGGGGVTIQFDTKPTSGSTNAVTSGGLYDLLMGESVVLGGGAAVGNATGIAIGYNASTPNKPSSLAIGYKAKSTGYYNVALGSGAEAANSCVAIGNGAMATFYSSISIGGLSSKFYSMALGAPAKAADDGTICLGTANNNNNQTGVVTRLYIVGANSPLANKYYGDENGQNGAAFMGYVTRDWSGNVFACGTKKLSDLFNENTAFATAILDLDAPAPTPFLPTGATDPIELPENLTE